MGIKMSRTVVVGALVMATAMVGWNRVAAGQATEPAGGGATAPEKVTLESVKQHITEFKESLAKVKPADESMTRMRQRAEISQLFTLMDALSDNLDAGQFEEATRALRSAVARADTEDLRSKLTQLMSEVNQVSVVERASYGDKVEALLKRVPGEMRNATKADDLKGLQGELQAAQRRLTEGRMPTDARGTYDQWRSSVDQAVQSVQRYSDMLSLEEEGDVNGALAAGAQLVNINYNGRSVPARDAIQKRIDALEKKRDEATRKQLAGMAETVRNAKTSADLSGVIDQLQSLNNKAQRQNGYSALQRYSTEQQVLQTWGRVLDLESQKKFRTALSGLTGWRQRMGLDSRGENSTLVTDGMVADKMAALQKELLERGEYVDPTLKPLGDALSNAKSLEEMEKVASAIEMMGSNTVMTEGGVDADAQPVLQELQFAASEIRLLKDMERAIKAREWGRFWQIDQNMYGGRTVIVGSTPRVHRWEGKIDEERSKLVRQAVVENAELKELKVELKGDEPVDQAMLEAADAAMKGEEYRRAALVLRAYAAFEYGTVAVYAERLGGDALPGTVPAGLRADIQGLGLFAQGKSFEAAEDWVSAVAAYRGVVRLTGERVPVDAATKRLLALGKEHPDALRQADVGAGNSPAGAAPIRGGVPR